MGCIKLSYYQSHRLNESDLNHKTDLEINPVFFQPAKAKSDNIVENRGDYYPFGMEMPDRVLQLDMIAQESSTWRLLTLTVALPNPSPNPMTLNFSLSGTTGPCFDLHMAFDLSNFAGDLLVTVRDGNGNIIYSYILNNTMFPTEINALCIPVTTQDYSISIEPQSGSSGPWDLLQAPTINENVTVITMICGTNTNPKYSYGFNGKLKDNEIYGEGNAYDYGARMYDPRVGRWWSVEPLMQKYPYLSPYSFCNNNPIQTKDFDGRDFGIEIKDNKIIITAIYYTDNIESTNDALNYAIGFINSQSNKYQLVAENGKTYDIEFHLEIKTFTESDDKTDPKETAKEDNTANYASTSVGAWPLAMSMDAASNLWLQYGVCYAGDNIIVPDPNLTDDNDQAVKQSGAKNLKEFMNNVMLEEVLHSLGVSHKGMNMNKGEKPEFNKNTIKGILRQASHNSNSTVIKTKGDRRQSQADNKRIMKFDRVKSQMTSDTKKIKGYIVKK